jgi:hypothetical protein
MGKTIDVLIEKLKGIKYAFIGSAALWIRGVNVNPDDIDIVTDDSGVKKNR